MKLLFTCILCIYSLLGHAFTVTSTPSSNNQVGFFFSQTNVPSGGTAPYSYSLYYGELPPGTSLNTSNGTVSGYPTTSGTYSYQIKVTDSSSAVSYAIVEDLLITTGDNNPANDPTVSGLLTAQSLSAVLLTQGQIGNIMSHMDDLHQSFGDNNLQSNHFNLTFPNLEQAMGLYQELQEFLTNENPLLAAKEISIAGFPAAIWGAGEIKRGSISVDKTTLKSKFLAGSISTGVDLKLTKELIGGIYYGYSKATSDLSQQAGYTNSYQNSGAIYFTMQPSKRLYIDTMYGYGNIYFNGARYISSSNLWLNNDNLNATTIYGSVNLKYKIGSEQHNINPFIEANYVSNKFSSFDEYSLTTKTLSYFGNNFNPQFYIAGAVYNHTFIDRNNQKFIFIGKMYYSYAYGPRSTKDMYYTLIGPPDYFSTKQAIPVNSGSLNIGIRYLLAEELKIEFNWQGVLGGLDYQSNGFRLKISQVL